MKVNVKANIDPKLIAKRTPKADHALAEKVAADTEKFVPFLTGNLVNSTKVEGGKIIYPGPYAHYLYMGKVWIDPKINAAGFLTSDGWKSRYGAKKIETDRNLVLAHPSADPNAQPHWFEASKSLNLNKWLVFYKKELTDDN